VVTPGEESLPADGVAVLVALYPRALPQVYGYLLLRCRSAGVAEELTSETFMAASSAIQAGRAPDLSVAWLIGIARHKLVDHWRSTAREQRNVRLAAQATNLEDNPWDDVVNRAVAYEALAQLSANHRVALTLRYLDGLPVAEVASHVGRSVHATETLLVRARSALRRIYQQEGSGDV
jgi:RNA polymerase sigma-70 factor (ECF subfamily)